MKTLALVCIKRSEYDATVPHSPELRGLLANIPHSWCLKGIMYAPTTQAQIHTLRSTYGVGIHVSFNPTKAKPYCDICGNQNITCNH